jgi:diguanylate cyclase (GGDEF)-like protein/PAS domain S-box-containing protein
MNSLDPNHLEALQAIAATILVVDDEAVNRRLLEALLAPEGYTVLCADSGAQALSMAAALPPDLILLDVMMPGMDGYEVATRFKATPATAHIPIVMLSALVDRTARLAGLEAGAEEFLSKPIERAELWLRVRNLLRLKAFSDILRDHSAILEQQVRARTSQLQRFRSAMDATAEAIMLVERASMRFVEVNATACELLGYTHAELMALAPSAVGGRTRADVAASYDALIANPDQRELREIDVFCKDGSTVPVEVRTQAHLFEGEWIIVGVLRDLRERKHAEHLLHHQAHHDSLTGLSNRVEFDEALRKTLALTTDGRWAVSVLFINLDNFKAVNDTLGYARGDDLLVQVGQRLAGCVRRRDTVGRLGGDEFALVLVTQGDKRDAGVVAASIAEAFRAPFAIGDATLQVSASIGISVHCDEDSDAETLTKNAHTAMMRAKHAGRDTLCFFTEQMNTDVQTRMALERDLRLAVEREEFVLHYQPKVALASGRVVGLEALLRWNRPGHGIVLPGAFVNVLEETGLIVAVGRWVIDAACRQIDCWQRGAVGAMPVAVNVAARQFAEGNLEDDVVAALARHNVAADLLELELTEGSLMVNTDRTIATLRQLKRLGVPIAIDDFGTGYSSLAYLRRFPIDTLKIDIAFIREVTFNPDDAAIVKAIIGMAHDLRLDVVAEGVETEAQLAYLRRHHCDQVQGYLFSRPLALAELDALLLSKRGLPENGGQSGENGKALLLVDDEPNILSSLARLFRSDGYRVLTAGSAAEAFELLALHAVQVIICDQRMPVMSGTEFFDGVKDMYPTTFRIVLSGQTDLASITEAINRGAIYRFYTKPWDNAVLRENVREAFRHHALLHAAQ